MDPVNPDTDFLALEREILELWRSSRAFDRLRELRADSPVFRFVDGPITANNPMGVHHARGRSLKDVFLRYKAMQGHRCRYQNGFDCQGLWVEVEVEKELGFNGKPDIERFGLAEFSRACRERVETYSEIITQQSIRLGQWMDWENSYYTHEDENILGIWHFLQLCHERGWLYQGSLPMPWCPRCGTSLSEHEMAGSYRQIEHLAVYAQVPLSHDNSRKLLVWTTTPWTLPANTALAVNPDLEYVEVRSADWDHTLILGAHTQKQALGDIEVKVVQRFKGRELVGLSYETFLPDLPVQVGIEHRVVPWDHVDEAEGSGIVHIAPGCGREDYELSQLIGLSVLAPVDESAHYVEGYDWLTGRPVSEVAEDIVDRLQGTGKLYRSYQHSHSFPMCWRCKGELVFRLVGEWFIACEEIRSQLLEAARSVEWMPGYIGKRMEDWLNNMGDWCISRKRYWGLPLPFYCCSGCDTMTVVGSLPELRRLAVDPAELERLPELHRPWIDAVRISCPSCGEVVERVPEVGDCWLDAGIVPFTTLGYFEDRAAWEELFPADWICEMREQVRLWYYSMLFMGTVVEGRVPYKRALSYERVISEEGAKFSKSGFMIHFDSAVSQMGADVVRYLFCHQSVTAESRFGLGLGDIVRRRLTSLWNIYCFFVTYYLIDKPQAVENLPDGQLHVTDRWLLARTRLFVENARAGYENWNTADVIREFESYLDDLSNWYVRVNRRRFWRQAEHEEDKSACYAALYTALKAAIQTLAPIAPFLTEAIWQNLVRSIEDDAPESVHHAEFPSLPEAWHSEELLASTTQVREAISEVLRMRNQRDVRVRQPLPALHVHGTDSAVEAIRRQEDTVRSELNVERIEYPPDSEAFETDRVELDFKAAGPALRGDVGKVKALLEELDAEASALAAAAAQAGEPVTLAGFGSLDPSLLRVSSTLRPGFEAGEVAGLRLWLDVRIDDRLHREGLLRDLIRRVQIARRDANLDIDQSIRLRLGTGSAELLATIEEHAETLQREVLASSLETDLDGDEGESWTIQELPVRVAIEPVDLPGSG